MTNSEVPLIARPGIYRGFKKTKAYLEAYTRGFQQAQIDRKITDLQRYANEGEGFPLVLNGREYKYTLVDARRDLAAIAAVARWEAIQGALGGSTDNNWQLLWQRAVTYDSWVCRMEAQVYARNLAQSQGGNPWPCMSLLRTVGSLADSLALGWLDQATELAKRALWGMDVGGFGDGGEDAHLRTQFFVLLLIHDWQEWPDRQWPAWASDEPLFDALIDHWRTPDAEALTPLLLAACDRHTHESRYSNAGDYDIYQRDYWYDPFEVLAVLKLRQLLGLANPVLSHLLMDTPLGQLPEPVPPYTDAFIDDIVARTRELYPDL